jgi:hypothetical protein
MLGSFYGRTWEFERWRRDTCDSSNSPAHASSSLPTTRLDLKKLRTRAKTYSGAENRKKMHAPQIERTLHLGGGGSAVTNGVSNLSKELQAESNGHAGKSLEESKREIERDMLKVNEVFVPVPPGLVEAVFAAWVLLVLRWQRDAFHGFSYGAEGEEMGTVLASELKLAGLQTIADILDVVRRVMSKQSPAQRVYLPGTLVFNDATNDEV